VSKLPPVLSPAAARRHVKECLDFDYLAKLTPEEMAWLETFAAEYYHTHFKKNVDPIHPDDQRKSLYGANNARYRDLWNQSDRISLTDAYEYLTRLEERGVDE
jgi:hypothetical protein